MPAALLGAVSCVRCARPLDAGGECPRCTVGPLPAASGNAVRTAGPLTGVVRATRVRRNLAHLIDLIPLALIAAAAGATSWATSVGLLPPLGWYLIAAILAVVFLATQLTVLRLRGRTLGRRVLNLRTVDDLTGLPMRWSVRVRQIGSPGWTRRIVTADLRRGRDPVRPVDLEKLAALDPSVPQVSGDLPAVPTGSIEIVLDTDERHVVHSALLIGRLPDVVSGGVPLLAWPDMSRTLSRTHALLEWSGSVLWVTDLHSAHGTVLVSPGGDRRPLAPGVRGAAAPGWRVECGGRSFTVEPITPLTPSKNEQSSPEENVN